MDNSKVLNVPNVSGITSIDPGIPAGSDESVSFDTGLLELTPDKNEFTPESLDELTRACDFLTNYFETLSRPYTEFTEETVSKVRFHKSQVANACTILNRASDLGVLNGSNPSDFRKLFIELNLYGISGKVDSLKEYEGNIKELEDFGVGLLDDDLFSLTLSSILFKTDVYLSGGSIHRALAGQYKEGFHYESDLDLVVEEADLESIYIDLERSLSDRENIIIDYFEKPIPQIAIREKDTGIELICIISTETSVARFKKIAGSTNLDLDLHDTVGAMYRYGSDTRKNQIAIKFSSNHAPDSGPEVSVMNAGCPMFPDNLNKRNPDCLSNVDSIRRLPISDLERRWASNRLIRSLARIPLFVEKGTKPSLSIEGGTDFLDTLKGSEELTAFSMFLELARSNKDPKLVDKVRSTTAINLVRSMQVGNDAFWEGLLELPIESVFSETLMLERGYREVSFGSKAEDSKTQVILPANFNSPELQKLGVFLTLLVDPYSDSLYGNVGVEEEYEPVYSVSEVFALMAGFFSHDKATIEKIAGEIESSWNITEDLYESYKHPVASSVSTIRKREDVKVSPIFNKEKFIKWATEINDAVSGFSKDIKHGLPIDTDGQIDYDGYENVTLPLAKSLVKAIKDTSFWEERKNTTTVYQPN